MYIAQYYSDDLTQAKSLLWQAHIQSPQETTESLYAFIASGNPINEENIQLLLDALEVNHNIITFIINKANFQFSNDQKEKVQKQIQEFLKRNSLIHQRQLEREKLEKLEEAFSTIHGFQAEGDINQDIMGMIHSYDELKTDGKKEKSQGSSQRHASTSKSRSASHNAVRLPTSVLNIIFAINQLAEMWPEQNETGRKTLMDEILTLCKTSSNDFNDNVQVKLSTWLDAIEKRHEGEEWLQTIQKLRTYFTEPRVTIHVAPDSPKPGS
jgi:hypothetical protein